MIFEVFRRLLSWAMALMMLVSSAPVNPKDDPETPVHGGSKIVMPEEPDLGTLEGTEDFFGIDESNPLWHALLEMNKVMVRYLGTSILAEEEIIEAVKNMNLETMLQAKADIEALQPLWADFSEEEIEDLLKTNTAKSLGVLLSAIEESTTVSSSASKTCSVLGGSIEVVDTQGTGSVSNDVVTITVKGGLLSGKTNTIDVYNNTGKAATIRFDFSVSNYSSFSESGTKGSCKVFLEPNASYTLTLKSKANNETATLVLSNFSLVPAATASDVTFDYDSAAGSVTVNGAAVASGSSKNIAFANGATLVATPSGGAKFVAWVDALDNRILSVNATYTLKPASAMTVKAVFSGNNSAAYFSADGNKYLYSDLNAAATYAANAGNKTVVLMNDGTLSAGNYVIPKGVTLLIPFDAANTIYTDAPESVYEARTTPTAYRTLTMASGANITVNGVLSLPAKHFAAVGSKPDGGSPDGPCGFIKMSSGSNITVNSGAVLYAYGYIIGSGSVVAKKGAKIYEYFQIMDFRGGSQTSDMKNGVFPLSQYYIQNIEVPMTIESGAVESCYTSIRMSNMSFGAGVDFLSSSGAMFNLTSGSVKKYYDVNTDRLVFEVDGDLSISPIELSLGSGIMATKINSKNYELPINGNITVKVNSGKLTLAQDVAMLPGAEFIIGENASCVVASGANVYVYDSAQWGNFCSSRNFKFIPVSYAPGRKYTCKEADLKDARICVDGLLDASAGYIYTTAGGADICSTGTGEIILKKGSQTVTYQLVQNTGYTEIPITAAKLKNADGTYKETTSASSTNYYVDGVWKEHSGHSYTEEITKQPDCENNGVKTLTCFCGHSYTETIPATGHNASDKANCENAQTCLTCGKELEAALGHNYKSVVTKPDCTNGGFTTHTCQRCSHTYVDSETPAKGHTPNGDATCSADSICTVCGEIVEKAKGHSYSATVTAPTCTESGYTTHKCSACGDEYTDSVVEPKGHTAGADATCTQPQICTVCGETLKSENGHTPGNDATCTQAQTCTVCGVELKAALGHEMIHNEATDATCTEDGFSSGSYCVRCDYTEGKHVIPAKGHSVNAQATCTTNSVCTVCHTVVDVAKGHNYKEIVTLPTCTDIGYTTYICLTCGHSYTANETAEKGHTAGAEATCTEAQKCVDCSAVLAPAKGHTAGAEATCSEAQKCTVCSQELAPKKEHIPGGNATCLKGQTCKLCGEELSEALGHRFGTKTVKTTCTENGSVVHTCLRCRYEYIESETPATGHDMTAASCTAPATCINCGHTEGEALGHTEVIDEGIPAHCEDEGLTEGSHCSVCGEIIRAQEIIPVLGHNLEYFEAKAPTYTSVGWEAYEDCTRCAYTTYVEIPMLEEVSVSDYETFTANLALLEELANSYASEVPGKDPAELVIKYIRTGVEDYVDGSWGIMAGSEDKGFADYVARIEDEYNSMEGVTEFITVSALKNIELFELPNGDLVDFGHMFGAMDITYYNKKSLNHADVAGWAGDIVDLIEFSDYGGTDGTLEEMIETVAEDYFLKDNPDEVGGFNQQDIYADLDAYYLMKAILGEPYSEGNITALLEAYFTEELSLETRADYFLKNRLGGVSTRQDVRDAVYNAYLANKMITTLEATRDFKTSNLADLRKACCYVFADYICKLAGDYVEVTENPYFTVFASETSNLAPGIVQNIKHATSADNKQMVYYTATADLSRDDVHIFANYKDNDPTSWGMQPVLTQANAAQNKYGNPESELYIENYNVIASINGDGFNMGTGEPGGLLIMDGTEYHGPSKNGFFGITKDGKAVIGTTDEYNTVYKDQLQEAIGGFGARLIKNGVIQDGPSSDYYTTRHSRTAIGITRTGKVVFMVLDGRQEPVSCGGSMAEIAHIMFEAGCVEAINLDGGGSTTYVAKLEGDDELSVANRPSDGAARSVSTSLLMVSTAPSSTAFDHAIIESEYDYLTKDTTVQLTASGVSATGNAAEIPEGAVWTVSDEKWGTVTQDGLFTALRNGSGDINLVLDGNVIGSKTIEVVIPDKVYFTKTNIDAVYGAVVELPVVALYRNKPVAITAKDVAFSMSNEQAGIIDGFTFVGTDGTGIKSVTVYAAPASDTEAKASVIISLYEMGELSFDFDQATGGDRTLAWYREISNATTYDNSFYQVIDPEKPMMAEYSFAIDMTQIPIPERLADLTSLLPGAELENASAWTFLMQLAERVSVLTEVKPTVHIDSRFDVDYSELKVINDYFELNGVEYDEATNTLTLTLNWIDQTQPIDPAMANPLCILSGIKLTPKADAQWNNDRITAVHSGEISYKVYMRATALYSFAGKPENQAAYGIYPFINPNLPTEKGGWFGDIYAEFEDSYTLSKAVKEGWVNEDGGFAYYADGVKYTGVKLVDGYYYDFGENGINQGQTKHTGVFLDEEASAYRYAKFGELVSGWHMIGEDWYYFHSDTMAAKAGNYKVGVVFFDFEETGKLVSGVWEKCIFGYRYFYGPSYYKKGWETIDGNKYYFENGYRYEGYHCVRESNSQDYYWYDFGTDGICKAETIPDGFYDDAGKGLCYVIDGKAAKGLHKIDGDYYLFDYFAHAVTGQRYAETTSCDLPIGTYYFGNDYKALNGVVETADGLHYYINGKRRTVGLVEQDGAYYFAGKENGGIVTNQVKYVWEGNGLLPEAEYEFGADGKMLDGIVEKDGVLYLYKTGKTKAWGLVEVDGAYYFAGSDDGRITVNESCNVWDDSGTFPAGEYAFGPDGKMLDGIVEKDGVLYYYKNGKGKAYGLIEIDGAYYFVGGANGELTVSQVKYVWEGNGLLPEAEYEFGPDGKMLDGIVEKDGVLYYYKNGKGKAYGLIEIDGVYYFVGGANGELTVNQVKYDWEGNGLLPEANYEFGPDGKMLDGIVEKDGVLYCYKLGKAKSWGLVEIDGAYYFAGGANGEITVNQKKYVWEGNGLLPEGNYEFGPDGKMLDGFVEKDGVKCYYIMGKPAKAGLHYVDGYYYFVRVEGQLIVNQTYYVWETNGLSVEMNHTFDENGRIVG